VVDTPKQNLLYNYTRYIEHLIFCGDLTATEIAVGTKIAKGYRTDWGYCCYSEAQIAEWLKVSTRSVVRSVKKLAEIGLLHITKRPQKRNRYIPIFQRINDQTRQECHPSNTTRLSQHSIDKTPTDSSTTVPESLESSYQHTEEPIACRAEESRDQAVAPTVVINPRKIEENPIQDPANQQRICAALDPPPAMTLRERHFRRRWEIHPDQQPNNWTSFSTFVLRHWPIPKKWDEGRFYKSVNAFINRVRREDPRWPGLRMATLRISRWFMCEWYKTEDDHIWRGFDEYVKAKDYL